MGRGFGLYGCNCLKTEQEQGTATEIRGKLEAAPTTSVRDRAGKGDDPDDMGPLVSANREKKKTQKG
jgi:hypothetical protein